MGQNATGIARCVVGNPLRRQPTERAVAELRARAKAAKPFDGLVPDSATSGLCANKGTI